MAEWKHHKLLTEGRVVEYNSSVFWDGGIDQFGKHHKSQWTKIAKHLIANNLNPETMIKAMFHKLGNQTPVLSFILSPTATEKYRSYLVAMKHDFAASFKTEKIIARLAVDNKRAYYTNIEQAVNSVLCDRSIDISALFRYCMAVSMRSDNVAQIWEQQALLQYMADRDSYDKIYKEYIPQVLKDWTASLKYELKAAKESKCTSNEIMND